MTVRNMTEFNGYIIGHDTSDFLMLFFDTGFKNFYEDFKNRVRYYDGIYDNILKDPKNVRSDWAKLYYKNELYNLEKSILDYYNENIFSKKSYWTMLNFPIYIIKNDWWYIIKDDEFIMEKTFIVSKFNC